MVARTLRAGTARSSVCRRCSDGPVAKKHRRLNLQHIPWCHGAYLFLQHHPDAPHTTPWRAWRVQDASTSGRLVGVGGDGHQLKVWDLAAAGGSGSAAEPLFAGKAGKPSRSGLQVRSCWA